MQSPVLVTLPTMRRTLSGRSTSTTDEKASFSTESSTPDVMDALEAQVHEVGVVIEENVKLARIFWRRFKGTDRWVPWGKSFKHIALSSPLNLLFIFIPFAWAAHFSKAWGPTVTFVFCFLAIIPLEQMFDFLGEQMMLYLGKSLGDLLVVTLNNVVEAALALILLRKCELRVLQASVAGVVLLHLLLIPGMAFLTGGARIMEQNLHAHPTELNHSLLTIGVLALVVPTAFFAALDRGAVPETSGLISDGMRTNFLSMSRVAAFILLIVYIASRAYLFDPPGEGNALKPIDAPEAILDEEEELVRATPKVNVWTACGVILLTIGLVTVTAEMLVESIDSFSDQISLEWFGLILLPLVSFAADGTVATLFFFRYSFSLFFGRPPPPAQLAKGRSIDMSIQFLTFWLPVFVLIGWWLDKPLSMLFDLFEVVLLLGACFLVNTVTADAKTNWVEGVTLVGLYALIATASWWYSGQETAEQMLRCGSVLAAEGGELVQKLFA